MGMAITITAFERSPDGGKGLARDRVDVRRASGDQRPLSPAMRPARKRRSGSWRESESAFS